jgi:hypothetical protein
MIAIGNSRANRGFIKVAVPTETQEAAPARVGRFDEAILAISRGRQLNSKLLMEGLRKAGLPE